MKQNRKPINVLSCFDGMSCLQIALKESGIKVNNYYASEIDKYAIKVTQHNFTDTIQLGDITKWKEWDIDWSSIDLIGVGSPCQGFSFAGKGLAFDDPRSKLFFVFVDILSHVKQFNPDVKFLLENVRMKKEHEAVITEYMGVSPLTINSALISAQNRVRLYWSNFKVGYRGLFSEPFTDIPQPADKGIPLKHILETDVDEKYFLSDKAVERMIRHNYSAPQINPEKTGTLNTKNNSGQLSYDSGTTLIKIDKSGNPKPNQDNFENPDKSYCIDANYYKGTSVENYLNKGRRQIVKDSGGNHSDMDLIVHNLMPRSSKSGKCGTGPLSRNDGKTYCLDTGSTNAVEVRSVIQLNPSTESGGNQPYQQNRVYDENGISPTLDTRSDQKNVYTNFRIRRLTPTECMKLQTVPSWYDMSVISETQQYRCLGNGWTVDVITHLLKYYR